MDWGYSAPRANTYPPRLQDRLAVDTEILFRGEASGTNLSDDNEVVHVRLKGLPADDIATLPLIGRGNSHLSRSATTRLPY
jgi:hypothetical protein